MEMTPMNALIFGLGLFFLGLRLIGENLRQLWSGGFRTIIKRTTHSPPLGAGLGVVAGALMQSATAVTFVLVSMLGSGLLNFSAAAPIVIWCNVGLTALVFVTAFDIHPLVAFVVGGAGIVLGTIRIRSWQTVAGALLGLGLILIGLEQMSAGAAPLKDTAWFIQALSVALSNPFLTFLAGLLMATVLQSNTGAAMLVITFATAGTIGLEPAMLMIFGTNLGAIFLRAFLSAGLKGKQLRLVRLEDLFCLWSGLLMMILFIVEKAGVPLVHALVQRLSDSIDTQLALVFLFSNLFPAITISPCLPACRALLKRIWPTERSDQPGQPLYLTKQALNDPASALDLLSKETARLFDFVTLSASSGNTAENFAALSQSIENFAAKLAARNILGEAEARHLHLLRAELSIMRHAEETLRHFAAKADRCEPGISSRLKNALRDLLTLASRAAESGAPVLVAELYEKTSLQSKHLSSFREEENRSLPLESTALIEDFTMCAWTLHRLAKLLSRVSEED